VRFLALALACAAPAVAGTIEGRVTNSVTGEAIVGAKVRFQDRNHAYDTVSGTSGMFRLTGVPDGNYKGAFSKDGFADSQRSLSIGDVLGGANVAHVSGDVPAHLDAQLHPWGGLRGRVVDEEGRPAAKVRVQISRSLDNDTTTDERGEFVFQELNPGTYTVVAKPVPSTRIRDGEQVGTVPVYYPSTTQLADASPIDVRWGSDVAGIEIRLKTVPVRRVRGVVLDQGGKPVYGATVMLLGRPAAPRQAIHATVSAPGPPSRGISFALVTTLAVPFGPGPEPELAEVKSRDDGSFEFPAVERGDWRLSADTYVDERPRSGVVSVAVGDNDVEGVQIRISGPFHVEVTADWGDTKPPKPSDGAPVPTAYLVRLGPEEGQPVLDFDAKGNVTSVNGTFPGRYRVTRSPLPGGIYAASVMLGGKDVLGQTVDLAPGFGPLQVVVKHDAGSVRGSVENCKGGTVFLISGEVGGMVEYRSAMCAPTGLFEFQDVIPGNYYLVAFHRGGLLPSQDLMQFIQPLATRVHVDAAASVSVNLNVNRWSW
jgi:hypothetical protein